MAPEGGSTTTRNRYAGEVSRTPGDGVAEGLHEGVIDREHHHDR